MKIFKLLILFTLINSSFSYAKSSEENRENKKFHVNYFLGIKAALFIQGVEFKKFNSKNDLIGASVNKGVSNTAQTIKPKNTTMIDISYTHYTGNSFFVRGAMAYRNFSETAGTRVDLQGSIAIGNVWHWKNMTFGFDWLGFGTSLANVQDTYASDDDEFRGREFSSSFSYNLGYTF